MEPFDNKEQSDDPLKGLKVGLAITGSFCMFGKVKPLLDELVNKGCDVQTILSQSAASFDTRFDKADEFKNLIESKTGKKSITTIVEAEPIGPESLFDIIVVAPCTGNTVSKIANAITDTTVTMAVKAHLRNDKPVLLAISTNDGLGNNAKNIGLLLNMKNMFFVPFGQDDPVKKRNSLTARFDLVAPAIIEAIRGRQIQPVLI